MESASDAARCARYQPVRGHRVSRLLLKKLALRRIDCYASDRGAARHTARLLNGELARQGFVLHEVLELSSEPTYIAYSAQASRTTNARALLARPKNI